MRIVVKFLDGTSVRSTKIAGLDWNKFNSRVDHYTKYFNVDTEEYGPILVPSSAVKMIYQDPEE